MRKFIVLVAAVIGVCIVIDVVRNVGGVIIESDKDKANKVEVAPVSRAATTHAIGSQPVQPTGENAMSDEEIRQLALSAAKEEKAVTLTPLSSGLRAEAAGIQVNMPGTLVSNNAVRGKRLVVTETKAGLIYGFFVSYGDNWGESPMSSLAFQFMEDVNNKIHDPGWDTPPVPVAKKLGRSSPMPGLLWEISGQKLESVLWTGRSQNGRYVGVYVLGRSGITAEQLDAKEVERFFSSLQDSQ